VANAPSHARVHFHHELNDHLPPDQRRVSLEKPFFVPASVKDLIESFGVPHTEVARILVNNKPVDFAYVVQNEDSVAVYPDSKSAESSTGSALRPPMRRPPRFVLDVHLGKLAAYLRMLGFDAFYHNCFADSQLASVSAEQERVLLTRDRGLLKHSQVMHGYWLRETDSRQQIAEVLQRFELAAEIRPLTRCMACNGLLQDISKERARNLVPLRVAEQYHQFRQCPDCQRVYWRGTHYQRMERWIAEIRKIQATNKEG